MRCGMVELDVYRLAGLRRAWCAAEWRAGCPLGGQPGGQTQPQVHMLGREVASFPRSPSTFYIIAADEDTGRTILDRLVIRCRFRLCATARVSPARWGHLQEAGMSGESPLTPAASWWVPRRRRLWAARPRCRRPLARPAALVQFHEPVLSLILHHATFAGTLAAAAARPMMAAWSERPVAVCLPLLPCL